MVSRSQLLAPAKRVYRAWINTTLTIKLALTVFLVISTIAVAGYGVVTETQSTLADETEEELRQNAGLQHTLTDNWYETTERDAILLSQSDSISPDTPALNQTLLEKQIQLSSATVAIHYYDISDDTPALIATSSDTHPDPSHWQDALTAPVDSSETVHRSEPYTVTTSNTDSTYATPTQDRLAFIIPDPVVANHRLVLEVDLQQSSQQLRSLPDGRSYVINHDGIVLLSSNPSAIGENAFNSNRITPALFDKSHVSQSAFATTQYTEETSLGGTPYATATAHVNSNDWIVVSQLDHSTAFALERNILALFQPFFILLVTAVGIAALAIGVPTFRDLQRLTGITKQIHDQNFDIDIPTWRTDEFGALYRDIDDMRISLDGYITEINTLNNTLQNVVQEQSEVMSGVADGDLTQQMNPNTDIAPLDSLADNFNTMVGDVRNMVIELRQSETELQNFLFIATHDLREPLRMIDSYIGLLEMEFGDELDDEGEQYLEIIQQSAVRINTMIEDLYTYLNARTSVEKFEKTDLTDVIDSSKNTISHKIAATNANITTEPLPTVHADPSRLEDVFTHLLSNAIQYTEDEVTPKIDITARTDADTREHIISVSDNGIGIPENQHEKVFEIFNRLSRDESGESTGIGLAIAKRIIEDHNGRIWVEPTDTPGCTISIAIPVNPKLDNTEFNLGDAEGIDNYRTDLERRLNQ